MSYRNTTRLIFSFSLDDELLNGLQSLSLLRLGQPQPERHDVLPGRHGRRLSCGAMARSWAELLGEDGAGPESDEERSGFFGRLRDSLGRSRRALTEQLEAAVAPVPSWAGVVVIDNDMRVLAWNAKAQDLWGLRSDEVVG